MYDISQKSQRDLHSKVTYSHNSPSSCIFVVASQSFPSSSSSPAAIIQLFPPKLFVLPLTFLCIFFFLLQSLLRSSFLPHFFLSSDNRSLKSSFFLFQLCLWMANKACNRCLLMSTLRQATCMHSSEISMLKNQRLVQGHLLRWRCLAFLFLETSRI